MAIALPCRSFGCPSELISLGRAGCGRPRCGFAAEGGYLNVPAVHRARGPIISPSGALSAFSLSRWSNRQDRARACDFRTTTLLQRRSRPGPLRLDGDFLRHRLVMSLEAPLVLDDFWHDLPWFSHGLVAWLSSSASSYFWPPRAALPHYRPLGVKRLRQPAAGLRDVWAYMSFSPVFCSCGLENLQHEIPW
jgi:hypothetical protein